MNGTTTNAIPRTGRGDAAPSASSPAGEGLRILIVEDHDVSRRCLEEVLQKEAYSVCSVPCGEDGLGEIEADRFDVLLTDLHLRGIDGFDLITRAKEVQPLMHVLLMTGDGRKEVYELARDVGVDVLMEKPMELGRLLAFLDWIDRRIREGKWETEKEPG